MGPNGAGAMSGRSQGYCSGNTIAGFRAARFFQEGAAFYGRRNGRGGVGNQFGGGFGRRSFLFSSSTNEKTMLENEIEELKSQLDVLENKIKNLEK
jgi:hypothetical protein